MIGPLLFANLSNSEFRSFFSPRNTRGQMPFLFYIDARISLFFESYSSGVMKFLIRSNSLSRSKGVRPPPTPTLPAVGSDKVGAMGGDDDEDDLKSMELRRRARPPLAGDGDAAAAAEGEYNPIELRR
jgi:hypothetical protein